jgi:hypothetical protein
MQKTQTASGLHLCGFAKTASCFRLAFDKRFLPLVEELALFSV